MVAHLHTRHAPAETENALWRLNRFHFPPSASLIPPHTGSPFSYSIPLPSAAFIGTRLPVTVLSSTPRILHLIILASHVLPCKILHHVACIGDLCVCVCARAMLNGIEMVAF